MYRDKAFTFCSEDCLNRFTTNPALFIPEESQPNRPD
jgi:YHS domain-containing protein